MLIPQIKINYTWAQGSRKITKQMQRKQMASIYKEKSRDY